MDQRGSCKKLPPMPSFKPPPLPDVDDIGQGFVRPPGSRHGSRTPSPQPLNRVQNRAEEVKSSTNITGPLLTVPNEGYRKQVEQQINESFNNKDEVPKQAATNKTQLKEKPNGNIKSETKPDPIKQTNPEAVVKSKAQQHESYPSNSKDSSAKGKRSVVGEDKQEKVAKAKTVPEKDTPIPKKIPKWQQKPEPVTTAESDAAIKKKVTPKWQQQKPEPVPTKESTKLVVPDTTATNSKQKETGSVTKMPETKPQSGTKLPDKPVQKWGQREPVEEPIIVKKTVPKLYKTFGTTKAPEEKQPENKQPTGESEAHKAATVAGSAKSPVTRRVAEKVNERTASLNLTRLEPNLVFATGSATLRSLRLSELKVTDIIHACTAEETTPIVNVEGVANMTIRVDENKDDELTMSEYFQSAADKIQHVKDNNGVTMVHAQEGGTLRKGSSQGMRGEGVASALCAAYFIKHCKQTTDEALSLIRSRRPEAKPSPLVILNLMDFEKKVRKEEKLDASGPAVKNKKTYAVIKPLSDIWYTDWSSKMRAASRNWLPLSIYMLVLAIVFKLTYDSIAEEFFPSQKGSRKLFFGQSEEEEDMLCV